MDVASGNLIGTLLRVLNHDEENGRVYVRLQDGRSGSFAPEHGLTLARGDVLLVDEYGIPEPAPSDLWTEPLEQPFAPRILESSKLSRSGLVVAFGHPGISDQHRRPFKNGRYASARQRSQARVCDLSKSSCKRLGYGK